MLTVPSLVSVLRQDKYVLSCLQCCNDSCVVQNFNISCLLFICQSCTGVQQLLRRNTIISCTRCFLLCWGPINLMCSTVARHVLSSQHQSVTDSWGHHWFILLQSFLVLVLYLAFCFLPFHAKRSFHWFCIVDTNGRAVLTMPMCFSWEVDSWCWRSTSADLKHCAPEMTFTLAAHLLKQLLPCWCAHAMLHQLVL